MKRSNESDDSDDLQYDTLSGRKRRGRVYDIVDHDELDETAQPKKRTEDDSKKKSGEEETIIEARLNRQSRRRLGAEWAKELDANDHWADDGSDLDKDVEETVKFEPFHMKNEEEEGHFDADGTYVRNQDEDRQHDNWLQGISKQEIRKARDAALAKQKAASEEKPPREVPIILRDLVSYLIKHETPIKAMKRLGTVQRGKGRSSSSSSKEIEIITELCDELMAAGQTNIYELTREAVILLIERAGHSPPSSPDLSSNQWEFKYLIKTASAKPIQDSKIHGPYTSAHMLAWFRQGYLKIENCVIRRVGTLSFHPLDPNLFS